MRAVVQRCKEASVLVNKKIVGKIDNGLTVFVAFTENDSSKEIDYIVKKIINLRIFDDEKGIMNKSIIDNGGSILSISQFTLYADSSRGNRPCYIKALNGKIATHLYDEFNNKLNKFVNLERGIFGSDMQVNIKNDGPVTIIIDSK